MSTTSWKEAKWGDIATLEYGKSLKGYQEKKFGVPVFGTNGKIGFTEKKLTSGPGVIIGRKGAYRGVHYSSEDFYVIDTAFYLKPKFNGFLMKWAYYELLTNDINSMDSGSAIPSTSRSDFYAIPVKIPPIHVQASIVEILGSLDDKIELNRRMNETLEQMAMTLYKHWFVDEIIEETRLVRFGDYIQINPSISVKKGTELKFVEMKALPTRSLSVLDVDVVMRPYTSGSKFQSGDTLFARITPCLENGKTAFVDFLDKGESAFGSTEFLVLRSKENCNPYFVYCLSRSELFREYAMKSMVGTSGRQRVQTSSIEEYLFPQPNEEFMTEFEVKAKVWFDQIRSNTREIITLQQLRDYLLPRLLSGDIEIQAAEEHIEEVLSRD